MLDARENLGQVGGRGRERRGTEETSGRRMIEAREPEHHPRRVSEKRDENNAKLRGTKLGVFSLREVGTRSSGFVLKLGAPNLAREW
jgi:hypothetical protein